ncbi:MAG: c-type cytochrome [Gemmatimonadota bacterium]|nr:c-type cytochrome [Gemmatimonadota bacterium]MDH3421926.1 c-type cytochrome [Gemmatimonadota bacterium]
MSENHESHHVNYKKIYFTLLGLLVVSVAGPFAGILIVTLITAFGIAIVKANLVIQNFMHLKWEKRLMKWMLTTSLLLMALMFAGTSVDILNHEGRNWVNVAAMAAVERGIEDGEGVAETAEVEVVAAGFNVESMFTVVCATCHGQAGDGTGAAGAALDPRPANFTDPVFWETRDRARIVNVIANGATAVGGSALMVGWSASFTAEQIEEFADYVEEFRPEQ